MTAPLGETRTSSVVVGIAAATIVVAGLTVQFPADDSTAAAMESFRAPRSVVGHTLEAVAASALAVAALALLPAAGRLDRGPGTRLGLAALATHGLLLAPLAAVLAAALPTLASSGETATFESTLAGVELTYVFATVLLAAGVTVLAGAHARASVGAARATHAAAAAASAVAAGAGLADALGVHALAPFGFLALVAYLWIAVVAVRASLVRATESPPAGRAPAPGR